MPSRYQRKSQIREPAKKIIIAMEGNATEPKYFFEIKKSYSKPTISIIPLIRKKEDDGLSSPLHVINQLNDYKKRVKLTKTDELWLVIDIDSWPKDQLNKVISECYQRKYFIALSNPCFEIWLILHYKDLYEESPEIKNELVVVQNTKRMWGEINIEYKTSSYSQIVQNHRTAIANAKKLDSKPEAPIPDTVCTRVYHLLESIMKN